MISLDKIEALIVHALRGLAEDLEKPALDGATADTVLYGPDGNLDSLALVHLITEVEAAVAEEMGKEIVLADERAMSRSRSPFRTVATLRDHVAELLVEEEK